MEQRPSQNFALSITMGGAGLTGVPWIRRFSRAPTVVNTDRSRRPPVEADVEPGHTGTGRLDIHRTGVLLMAVLPLANCLASRPLIQRRKCQTGTRTGHVAELHIADGFARCALKKASNCWNWRNVRIVRKSAKGKTKTARFCTFELLLARRRAHRKLPPTV